VSQVQDRPSTRSEEDGETE